MVAIDFPDVNDLPDWLRLPDGIESRQLGSDPREWLRGGGDGRQLTEDVLAIADRVDQVIIRYDLPAPLLRPTLEQFSLVDSDRLRGAAEAWRAVAAGGDSMVARLTRALGDAVTHTGQRWTGTAQENFASWIIRLDDTLDGFQHPAEKVARELDNLAEKFELTGVEVFGLVSGVIGLATAALAFVDPEVLSKVLSAILAVVGMIMAVLSAFVTLIDAVKPRFQAAHQAAAALRDEIGHLVPRDVPETALRQEDWQRDTADPTS